MILEALFSGEIFSTIFSLLWKIFVLLCKHYFSISYKLIL